MKIYYAHAINIYDTPQEERDLNLLNKLGDVVNPNTEYHSNQYKLKGMSHFMDVVVECDMLAFRPLPDGSIPKGVAREIEYAIGKFMPIIELPAGIRARTLDVEQTREYLRNVGQR